MLSQNKQTNYFINWLTIFHCMLFLFEMFYENLVWRKDGLTISLDKSEISRIFTINIFVLCATKKGNVRAFYYFRDDLWFPQIKQICPPRLSWSVELWIVWKKFQFFQKMLSHFFYIGRSYQHWICMSVNIFIFVLSEN
jgi:hypothetical protein